MLVVVVVVIVVIVVIVVVDKLVKEVADDAPAVTIEALVLEGDPSQRLLELASDAELLVVGDRGHGVFASVLLGSVASKCAHHSAQPVAIVRPHRAKEGDAGSAVRPDA